MVGLLASRSSNAAQDAGEGMKLSLLCAAFALFVASSAAAAMAWAYGMDSMAMSGAATALLCAGICAGLTR